MLGTAVLLCMFLSFCGCSSGRKELVPVEELEQSSTGDGQADVTGDGSEDQEISTADTADGADSSNSDGNTPEESEDAETESADAAGTGEDSSAVSGEEDTAAAEQDADGTDVPETESAAVSTSWIYVDVNGAVANPGVYQMQSGSRVYQAIQAAGGFTGEASGASVNQALPLLDGQQVYVPTLAEVEAGTAAAPGAASGTTAEDVKARGSDALAGDASGSAAAAGGGSAVSADGVVNLNTATSEELQTLSGIGEAKAQAILSYREEHGSFSSAEEIMQVSGIGEGTYAKIKDRITV